MPDSECEGELSHDYRNKLFLAWVRNFKNYILLFHFFCSNIWRKYEEKK